MTMTETRPETAVDQWAWWRGAAVAAGQGALDAYIKAHPVNANDVESGFYETRSKNKATGEQRRGVVAFWRDEAGRLLGKAGKDYMMPEAMIADRWLFALKRPIPHATYKFWIETGAFPDEHEAATRDRNNAEHAANDDSFEAIKDRVDDLMRDANALIAKGSAKSIEESNRAADLADRLRKLEVRADELRKTAKQPHTDAAAEVDRQWNPVRDTAERGKAELKRVVVTPFEVAERKRQDAIEAEARAKAAQTGTPAPAPVAAPRRTAGTAARVGLREVKTAVLADYPKALAYFANNEKVRALIQQLANAAVKQGTTPDGCTVHTDQQAA